jgi:hypothetical protein
MAWDSFERERFEFEEKILKENHPGCEVSLGSDYFLVKIWHCVGTSWYLLRIRAGALYPDQKPEVYVEHPLPLPAYGYGRKISDYAPSHNYHVLTTSAQGEVQICHFSDGAWDASKTIHLVVLKAKLWLQAYAEHHLRTGQPICDFFNDCIFR